MIFKNPSEMIRHPESTLAQDDLVIIGLECYVPGADDVQAFRQLLALGKSAYVEMDDHLIQSARHFDARLGRPGKTYTKLGGMVSEKPFDLKLMGLTESESQTYDPVHLRFCQTALKAWRGAGLDEQEASIQSAGVYVGHSGATRYGGDLSLGTMIEEGLDFLKQLPAFCQLTSQAQKAVIEQVAAQIRESRPQRSRETPKNYEAYTAASLPASRLGLRGPKLVVDAACASSLYALQHAALAIRSGRIPAAIVGGATSNSVDNLILFSQSQACSPLGSFPFDQQASGLVSSEGYAAIVVTTRRLAEQWQRPILATIEGIGTASDGRGKSLWAPRQEGQVLAISRAYPQGRVLEIDYLEAHATGTQLGDATELESVSQLRSAQPQPLLMGSVKSNLGHTLETAGLVGLTKIILAMTSGQIPPTIHVSELTDRFDWSQRTIEIVRQTKSWPRSSFGSKRGAVSAFGIGGLNAHVTLRADEAAPASSPSSPADAGLKASFEPIAIVGRGLVLPGAKTFADFARVFDTDSQFIRPMPDSRWRGQVGVTSGSRLDRPHHSPTNLAGWIEGYQFDSREFRIPPKQITQSNPIQMMLLDAVRQALGELGVEDVRTLSRTIDTVTTGVVVGTVFGGEFSNQLQYGLRLPEICEYLHKALLEQGLCSAKAAEMCQQFREAYLQARPALLDETGSFTASTLSSRIAKSFDCMGGACSVDADDTSDLAALTLAIDYLQTGLWSTAIVGTAQRSLDLASFAQLDAKGRLVRSGRLEDVLSDGKSVLPGEGVVVFVLEKYSTAKAKGHKVFGVFDSRPKITRSAQTHIDESERRVVQKFGYLVGSEQFVCLAAGTAQWEQSSAGPKRKSHEKLNLVATAQDQTTYCITCTDPLQFQRPAQTAQKPVMTLVSTSVNTLRPPMAMSSQSLSSEGVTLRLAGESLDELKADLERVLTSGRLAVPKVNETFENLSWRGIVRAGSDDQLQPRIKRLLQELDKGKTSGVFDAIEAAVWNRRSAELRVGWVYPGQGSYYDQPPGFLGHPGAESLLQQIDDACVAIGTQPIGPVMRGALEYRAQDIWMNQMWVLASSLISSTLLQEAGLIPDVVLGHSFGDYGALASQGALSIEQAVRLVKWRTDAVLMKLRQRGRLISVRGTLVEVQRALNEHQLPCVITHQNAPSQTVLAVSADDAERVSGVLMDQRLANLSLPIPIPYHTAWLSEAQSYLRQVMSGESLRPTRCAFLSTTNLKYLAEPDELKSNLLAQLTSPVLYQPAIERLMREGCQVLIEVGPNTVLSRMNHEISAGRVLCVSADAPGERFASRLAFIREILSMAGSKNTSMKPPAQNGMSTFSKPSGVESMDVTDRQFKRKATPAAATSAPVEVIDLRKGPSRPAPKSDSRVNGHRVFVEAGSAISFSPSNLNGNGSSGSHQPVSMPLSTLDAQQVETYLKTLLVELTGYDPSVIDLDAELEADLGVDSIKKAQMMGEAVECYGITIDAATMRLDQFKTLADIKALILSQANLDELTPVADNTVLAAHRNEELGPLRSSTDLDADAETWQRTSLAPAASSAASSPQAIADFLITLVVDQTGYDYQIVDLDAELEADLGIDSIKQAQILGEVQQHYEIASFRAERSTLSEFKTLRSIQEFLLAELSRIDLSSGEAGTLLSSDATSEVDQALDLGSLFEIHVNGHSSEQVKRLAYEQGVAHRQTIQTTLRSLFQRGELAAQSNGHTELLTPEVLALARGAGVAAESVQLARRYFRSTSTATSDEKKKPERNSDAPGEASLLNISPAMPLACVRRESLLPVSAPLDPEHAMRLVLRTVPAPQRDGVPIEPVFTGDALVLGENAIARELVTQLQQRGVCVHQLTGLASHAELQKALVDLGQKGFAPHLFITTPWDADSQRDFDVSRWVDRRFSALEVPYRICQRWMTSLIKAGEFSNSSLILVANAGGDFGFSGASMASIESGLSGLLKAIVIEAWMQGERSTPVKTIDVCPKSTPADAVRAIFAELAAPSYEPEIALRDGERYSVQAFHRPLNFETRVKSTPEIRRGSQWVITGGARGITTVVAREIAQKYGIVLHLVGKSPAPQITPEVRQQAAQNRAALKRSVIFEANSRGENGIEAWRNLEKAIEIDQSLARFAQLGIEAHYHSADVADAGQMAKVLQAIRKHHGPIEGILHGAGIGQDARFDLKRPDKVDQCLKAKIDGCLTLLSLTMQDPLKWVITFGSISGRFGANGHTDYSLANETMAKLIDRYRCLRPEVAAVNFHWHAWGDIGMATKPETRLALEMIDIDFMPAHIGLQHLMNELAYGGDEPEVLITDRKYYRKFFHRDRAETTAAHALPLLDPDGTREDMSATMSITFDPSRERCLSQHRVQGVPTLPFVVALELMAESVRASQGQWVIEARNVVAHQAVKFNAGLPRTLTLHVASQSDGRSHCSLRADVLRRDGQLVQRDKTFFEGEFFTGQPGVACEVVALPQTLAWTKVTYPEDVDGPIFHGESLRCLRRVAIWDDDLIGEIAANSPSHLASEDRPTVGWTIAPSVIDACLYASAILAGHVSDRLSLPSRFERIVFGRLPDPGEVCLVRCRVVGQTASGLSMSIDLRGQNGDQLFSSQGYQLAWLGNAGVSHVSSGAVSASFR